MNLKVISSSSAGNCYILENESEALILEAGVSAKRVKIALGFNTSKVVGCLISHEHGDHAKYAGELENSGITVYASKGTIEAIGSSHRTSVLTAKTTKKIGGFTVVPFPIEHDVREPFGYLIYHKEMGNVLFATDTYYLKYKFEGLNHVMIECNYDEILLKKNLSLGVIHPSLFKRTYKSHMSIENCISTLRANDTSKVRKIFLLHMSRNNSNEEDFVERVRSATGKQTFAAKSGLVESLDLTPF